LKNPGVYLVDVYGLYDYRGYGRYIKVTYLETSKKRCIQRLSRIPDQPNHSTRQKSENNPSIVLKAIYTPEFSNIKPETKKMPPLPPQS
jgi:hypothetical protein